MKNYSPTTPRGCFSLIIKLRWSHYFCVEFYIVNANVFPSHPVMIHSFFHIKVKHFAVAIARDVRRIIKTLISLSLPHSLIPRRRMKRCREKIKQWSMRRESIFCVLRIAHWGKMREKRVRNFSREMLSLHSLTHSLEMKTKCWARIDELILIISFLPTICQLSDQKWSLFGFSR
jgi:hypothetical protein